MRDRRLRQDAVAEVEDERTAGKSLHHRVDLTVERGAPGQQRQRIYIALHRLERLDFIAREGEPLRPVEADGIDAGLLDVAPDLGARPAREADDPRARHLR